ncbi:MAG: TatD family hydrolase [Candidatus Omnitrophica bacterium]|nr:TatD family hydrolase [Candidatus Omnitrophota bacterium]MDD5611275.1 TatD family hydrolase [Candidatus Omnitrophota bacterium]
MLIDTHCHLDFPAFDVDRESVIGRARKEGIGYFINIGSTLKNSEYSIALAKEYDFIYATVGIHPHEADDFNDEARDQIKRLAASNNKVVAIGEIGLDYFRNFSSPENQKKLFLSLASLAKELSLPLVIHCRDAQADVLEVLKPLSPHKVVVHCFSGDENFLKECLALGFFISFTLNITYKKAEALRKLVEAAPLERIFLETDAPFLPQESMRGKRNEPAFVKNLAEEVAKIKGVSFQDVAEATTANAKEFFKIK